MMLLKHAGPFSPLLVLVALLGAFPVLSAGSSSENAVYEVSITAQRPDGGVVRLRLDVAATSLEKAEEAAALALAEFAPDFTGGGDRAAAQWLPWPWKWAPDEIPVPVAYNPTGAPEAVGPSAIVAGLQAWSGVGTSSFRFRYAGITDNTASILQLGPDGENVISWASLPCEQGCVLGITSKGSDHEVDMLLNSNPAAAEQLGVGATLDWRTVIVHELGHMAGLEHSCPVPFGPCTGAEAEAVMHFQYRGILRKLAADDIAGLSALYPLEPAPVPTAAPANTPTPFPEFTVILERGWNLVVLPPGGIAPVAASLPCLEALYAFEDGAWSAWIRGLTPALQGLESVAPGTAYWARANASCAHVFP